MGRYTPGRLFDGRKVVALAGTRERLVESTSFSQEVSTVTITAEDDNTGKVVVGSSTVIADHETRRGIHLSAGDSLSINVTQLHFVYLDAVSSGDGVTWLAECP